MVDRTADAVIADLPNTRDLGGLACTGGSLRPGLLLRGAAPTDEAHVAAVSRLGIRTVVDLRTRLEREHQPVALPATATSVIADVLADAPYAGAANLGQMAAEALGGDQHLAEKFADRDLRAIMLASYRDFALLPSGRQAAGDVVRLLAALDADDLGPVLIHCTAGKDRTGWIVAVVLHLLGAQWDDITAEYLRSGPAVREMFGAFRDSLPDPEAAGAALEPVLGVFPEYIDEAREAAQAEYGSLDGYVRRGLQIDDSTIAALRSRLIQDSSASALL